MSTHPDSKYLEALKNNDSRLLAELYRDHSAAIVNWVRRNNGTEDDARDLFQEALLALHYSAHRPDFRLTCPIGGLIFTICRNRWINQLRRKRKESEVRIMEAERYEPESANESEYERIEADELDRKRLNAAFAQLSDTCQKLLRLLALGRKPTEAAEALGMTNANTVYRRKNACAERWRILLEAQKV